jgi:hypothetical protein
MLETFRVVPDQIEMRPSEWLEHPEQELKRMREERERLKTLETRKTVPTGSPGSFPPRLSLEAALRGPAATFTGTTAGVSINPAGSFSPVLLGT